MLLGEGVGNIPFSGFAHVDPTYGNRAAPFSEYIVSSVVAALLLVGVLILVRNLSVKVMASPRSEVVTR